MPLALMPDDRDLDAAFAEIAFGQFSSSVLIIDEAHAMAASVVIADWMYLQTREGQLCLQIFGFPFIGGQSGLQPAIGGLGCTCCIAGFFQKPPRTSRQLWAAFSGGAAVPFLVAFRWPAARSIVLVRRPLDNLRRQLRSSDTRKIL
jgi:hypothetical protein